MSVFSAFWPMAIDWSAVGWKKPLRSPAVAGYFTTCGVVPGNQFLPTPELRAEYDGRFKRGAISGWFSKMYAGATVMRVPVYASNEPNEPNEPRAWVDTVCAACCHGISWPTAAETAP